ncbi:MAG: MOSC domain-containing protein [Phycisphaerae bacterium]|nr:MOSC domain-containing protein [Saprospiraceae bacterium]
MIPHTLSEIWVYPIKSLGGIALQEALPQRRGLQYDRRWMLVDNTGRFVSQREIPRMALLGTAIEPPFLSVFWKDKPSEKIHIPLEINPLDLPKLRVKVWSDQCPARVLSDEINQWFSHHLGQNLRLVFMPDTTRRRADGRYAPPGHHVSFADGFPYLIIGQASLDELNRRLLQPLPMNRFRPNFVFTGGQPFEEDSWSQFSINDQPFQGLKPCARCIITTTDQDTATRAAEPLKTMATFRKFGNRILFGQNVVWLGKDESVVRVGDRIRK